MERAPRLKIALSWIALVAFFVLFFKIGESRDASFGIIALSSMVLATLVVGVLRARRALARIQKHLAEGEPDKLLHVVERKLRYLKKPRDRAPYLVFKAAGLSMKGAWQEGLEVLEEIDPDDLPEERGGVWRYGYYSARLSCLIFLERIEEARELFEEHLAPLEEREGLGDVSAALEAMRAELWFCEGERVKSKRVFEKLVNDLAIPPASRALFHYFLGRIFRDYDQRAEAERHFEQAVELGPKTWIPAGVRALEEQEAG